MKIEPSFHWKKQKRFRPEITNDIIEYCVLNSEKLKDRKWENAYNAISRIPPSGRLLKVVYREKGYKNHNRLFVRLKNGKLV